MEGSGEDLGWCYARIHATKVATFGRGIAEAL
jgi:hypothetical protein